MRTDSPYLLDANALIALVIQDHEHHLLVSRWTVGATSLAICPIVEGALVRFLVRIGENPLTAQRLLAGLYGSPRCVFWPDSVSYRELELRHVLGHRQVTDAYLAGLAQQHEGRLATLDRGLWLAFPDAVELIR